MTETHDPWARVIPLRPNPYSHQNYYVEEEVNAARAAVERQHAAALATLRAQLETLTGIVRDTLWMAGRYADRRMSYAVGLYNDARVKAEAMGCADGATIAIDGMDPVLPTWAERITDLRASIASVEGERERLKAALEQAREWMRVASRTLRASGGRPSRDVALTTADQIDAALSGEGTKP